MRSVSDKVVKKIKSHILCSIIFPENRAVYKIMLKNIVEPEKAKMTTEYGACALHAGQIRLQTHTQNM
jgi:ribosomal protein S26